jgi:hypothetical protein
VTDLSSDGTSSWRPGSTAEFTLFAHGRGVQPGTKVHLNSTASFTFSKFGAIFTIRVPRG